MLLRSRSSAAAALALSLALLGGCDRQPVGPAAPDAPALDGLPRNPPGREDAGFVAFTYSGAESGRFFAFGEPEGVSGSTPTGDDFAAARHYVIGAAGGLSLGTAVTASDRSGAGLADLFHLQFPGPLRTGTFTVSSCGRGGGPFCPLINLVFDVDPEVDGGGADARYYSLRSGTIAVESVDGGRVRGTFSGVAVRDNPAPGEEAGEITITGGRFDVPAGEVDLSAG